MLYRLHFNKYVFSAFITGFALMVVELVASRILAPIVGSSIYTWTSIIGIILLGLVIGNLIGGYAIDKSKSIPAVFYIFCLSALSVSCVPMIANFSHSMALLPLPLPFIILLLSAAIFIAPSIFIGSVYPCLYKFYVSNLESTGKSSAILSSTWSLGSIAGTFLTGFVFVGYIGSSNTLFLISLVLLANGLLVYYPKTIFQRAFYIFVISFIAFSFLAVRKQVSRNLVYEDESAYYTIKILDTAPALAENIRLMFLDFDLHSLERADKKELDTYTDLPVIFPILYQQAHNILVIGGGSEAISKNFFTAYPTAQVTTVEIDPAVAQASQQFFAPSKQFSATRISDGRVFLEKNPEKYDIIFSDAFNSFVSVPWHLSTREFNALAFDHLNDNGLYAVNFISAQTGDNSLFFQSMLRTFKETFPNFQVFALGNSPGEPQNIVLVGIKSTSPISNSDLRELLLTENINPFLRQSLLANPEKMPLSNNAPVLSDNFAPTERLMAPLIRNYFSKYSSFYNSMLY